QHAQDRADQGQREDGGKQEAAHGVTSTVRLTSRCRPKGSTMRRTTGYLPGALKVYSASGAAASALPSPSKSHSSCVARRSTPSLTSALNLTVVEPACGTAVKSTLVQRVKKSIAARPSTMKSR